MLLALFELVARANVPSRIPIGRPDCDQSCPSDLAEPPIVTATNPIPSRKRQINPSFLPDSRHTSTRRAHNMFGSMSGLRP